MLSTRKTWVAYQFFLCISKRPASITLCTLLLNHSRSLFTDVRWTRWYLRRQIFLWRAPVKWWKYPTYRIWGTTAVYTIWVIDITLWYSVKSISDNINLVYTTDSIQHVNANYMIRWKTTGERLSPKGRKKFTLASVDVSGTARIRRLRSQLWCCKTFLTWNQWLTMKT